MTRGPQRNGGARHNGVQSRIGKPIEADEPTPVCKADYADLEPAILALLADTPKQKRTIASALGVVEASLSELMTRMRRQQKIKLIGLTSGARMWALASYQRTVNPEIQAKRLAPNHVTVTKTSTLRAPHERPPSATVSKQQSWWCAAPRAEWQRAVDAHETRMRSARIAHFLDGGNRDERGQI